MKNILFVSLQQRIVIGKGTKYSDIECGRYILKTIAAVNLDTGQIVLLNCFDFVCT